MGGICCMKPSSTINYINKKGLLKFILINLRLKPIPSSTIDSLNIQEKGNSEREPTPGKIRKIVNTKSSKYITKVSLPICLPQNPILSVSKEYHKTFTQKKVNVDELFKYDFKSRTQKKTAEEVPKISFGFEEEKAAENFIKQPSIKSAIVLQRQPTFTLEVTPKEFRIERPGDLQDKYEVLEVLGKGGYGEVKKLQHKATKRVFALKTILKNRCQMTKNFVDEIRILRKLDHPNIVRFFEFYADDLSYYLITEFCAGGDLMKIMTKEQNFSERKASEIMYQILSGVEYCHKNKIVHRDLKPENVVFEGFDLDSTLKIIDFGRSTILEPTEKLTEKVGTLYYVAPEIILNKRYNEKCDIWSCGVVLYLMLSGYPPFYGQSRQETINLIVKGKLEFSEPVWNNISEDCKSLLQASLNRDVDKRISASQFIEHRWIKKYKLTAKLTGKEALLSLHNLRNFRVHTLLQGAVLSYIASQEISREEEMRIRHLFEAFDSNKDGELSKKELVRALEYLHGEGKRVHKEAERILNNIDINRNGTIEYNEFVMANMKINSLKQEEILKNAFNFYDMDGDGQITIEEITHVFGNICDERTLNHIIAEVDVDNDHQISFEEFKCMMKKYEKCVSFLKQRSFTEDLK